MYITSIIREKRVERVRNTILASLVFSRVSMKTQHESYLSTKEM